MPDIGEQGSFSAGDLAYLSDEIKEEDKLYDLTESFNDTGKKFSLLIPAERKLVITRMGLVPSNIQSSSRLNANADILFADKTVGNLFYNTNPSDTNDRNSRDFINPLGLIGDGKRRLAINVTGYSGDVSARILVMGFYRDEPKQKPFAIKRIQAEELSPDSIRLTFDAPLNGGGDPISHYEILRSKSADSGFASLGEFAMPEKESDIQYTDGTPDAPLDDNTTYYYKIKTKNSLGYSEFSDIVSAVTEIDHPSQVPGLAVEKTSPTSVRITINLPEQTGGVPIQGYHIQKRSKTKNEDFSTITPDTHSPSTTFDAQGLDPDTWQFRAKAVNTVGKSSLDWSDTTEIILSYAAPSNLRSEMSSDNQKVTLDWDASKDVPANAAHGYQIERGLTADVFSVLYSSKDNVRTNYTDGTISGGIVYYYRVAVLVGEYVGYYSETLKVEVPNRVPSTPRNLRLNVESHDKIKITFDAPLDNSGSAITKYELERSESIGFPDGVGGSTFEKKETPSPPTEIDGQTVVTSTITVPDNEDVIIGAVQLDVDISHDWRGDIELVLESPDGQSITLKSSDLKDSLADIKETYSGNIFNGLIGKNAKGAWSLKIKDIFSTSEDGTLNSWTLRIEPPTAAVTKIDVASDVTEYTDENLSADTNYFYRLRAENDIGLSHFSNTQNARTFRTVFGAGTDDLTVPTNGSYTISNDREYRSITVNDGAILYVSNAMVKCNRYDEKGTGKIIVKQTGCPGGQGGTTRGGRGGAQTVASRRNYQRSANIGTPATKTPATKAASCTDFDLISNYLEPPFDVDMFGTNFKNNVRGGKGSDGTEAQTSGNGGNSGTGGRWANSWRVGTRGGDGGTAAQGVNGVIGGGKAALIFNEIVTKITILAQGSAGKNGNRGTGQPGQPGGGASSRPGSTGSAGGSASASGTLGSAGSQGGIVFFMYGSIANDDESKISHDISGGLGGFNGGTATGTHPTTTRAATGPEGLFVSRKF